MQTHPDIGLLIEMSTDLLQFACFWLCNTDISPIGHFPIENPKACMDCLEGTTQNGRIVLELKLEQKI